MHITSLSAISTVRMSYKRLLSWHPTRRWRTFIVIGDKLWASYRYCGDLSWRFWSRNWLHIANLVVVNDDVGVTLFKKV